MQLAAFFHRRIVFGFERRVTIKILLVGFCGDQSVNQAVIDLIPSNRRAVLVDDIGSIFGFEDAPAIFHDIGT